MFSAGLTGSEATEDAATEGADWVGAGAADPPRVSTGAGWGAPVASTIGSGEAALSADQALPNAGAGSGVGGGIDSELAMVVVLSEIGARGTSGLAVKGTSLEVGRGGVPEATRLPLLSQVWRSDVRDRSKSAL